MVFVKFIGVKSCWSQCAVALPLNQDLGWAMWLQGFSLSMWMRIEHGGTGSMPGLTRAASYSATSDCSSASDSVIMHEAWKMDETCEYKK